MSESEPKKHQASQRKLQLKREQGSIPNSQDSTGMLSCCAGLIFLALSGWYLKDFFLQTLIDTFDSLWLPFDDSRKRVQIFIRDTMLYLFSALLASVLGVSLISTMIINKGPVIALKPVIPDAKRTSAIQGIKRIYGKRGMIETGVLGLRLFFWFLFSGIIFFLFTRAILESSTCDLVCTYVYTTFTFKAILAVAIALMIIFAVIDIIVQKETFLEQEKMTDSEVKRERKDQFGSPEVRKERQRIRNDSAASGGKALSVKDTTVLFRGPEGIVGITYKPPEQQLPIISIKARSPEDVESIMSEIREHGILVVDDPELVKGTINLGRFERLDTTYFENFARALSQR